MMRCSACLKDSKRALCHGCRKRLFDGRDVPMVLPFSRPAFEQAKREANPRRMSISGIQTKISLALKDRRLEMVDSGGQFILKPIPHGSFAELSMVPINEHLTMQIARQVFKIRTAENALVQFSDGEIAYLVRRFDIAPNGTRLLQEDFAQISGRTEETHGAGYKYDCTYQEIGSLIRKYVAAYPVDLERYFTLVAFNYFAHNGDAHAKNFSLIRNEETGEYNLTPAYDLLNTRLHVPTESRTALELFDDGFRTESHQANAFYAYDDFAAFAQKLGLVERRFQRILETFIAKRDEVLALIDRSMLSPECKDAYRSHIEDSIRAFSYSFAGLRK